LTKKPVVDTFPKDFFPRKIYYKKDAIVLQEEIASKGGESTIERG